MMADGTTNETTVEQEQQEEEVPDLSILDESLKASTEQQKAFQRRLATFSSATYFAKPASISPLVCARFGWKNVDTDLLVCENCHAAWAVVLRFELSAAASQNLCRLYERQLSETHRETCLFRTQAAHYLESMKQKKKNDKEPLSIVPTQLASVFSPEEMRILESFRPSRFLQALWLESLQALRLEDGTLGISTLELQAIRTYQPSTTTSDPETTALSQITETWIKNMIVEQRNMITQENAESVAALVLLGWRLHHQDTDENDVVCQCRLCSSRLRIPIDHKVDSPSNNERPAKRPRMEPINPSLAHRHYCPYVCGFPIDGEPRAKPIWQSLMDRLWNEFRTTTSSDTSSTNNKETIWIQVHKVLQSAISRKTPPSTMKKKPLTTSTTTR